MSKGNGWIALDKFLTQDFKSIKREFSRIEAMFSYSVDVDNGRKGTIAGYSKQWGWSRNKVRRFVNCIRTDEGHLKDSKRTHEGHPIHFIDNALMTKKDRKRTDEGQMKDTCHDTTIDPDPDPDPIILKNMSGSAGKKPKKQSQPKLNNTSEINEIFGYWKETLDHPRAKIDKTRKSKVRCRLKDGYSVDDIKLAIDGCLASPYHQGQNKRGMIYDDLELICRDSKHIDQFIKSAKEPNAKLISPAGRQARQNGKTWLQMRQAKREAQNG